MPVRNQVEKVVARIRPLLRADGGDMQVVEATDRRASVALSGKCAGCPSSHLTLHLGIESAIREENPGFDQLSMTSVAPNGSATLHRTADLNTGPGRSARREPFSRDTVVVGQSPRMREVLEFVDVIADSESSVLIQGESGTGKELIANLIHLTSSRRHRPFIAVSCATLSETLIESELFGHERGAFTNAIRERPGRFELADGGTLLLDDIDDVPLSMQVKLLRVLQSRTVERVGAVRTTSIDVRVLAGTKKSLKKLVADCSFREDLYYRLNVIPIKLPPLRERTEDIPLLVDHFLRLYFKQRGKELRVLSPAMMEAFTRYTWPGNVRELENACERIAQTCVCDRVVAGCVPAGILLNVNNRSEPLLETSAFPDFQAGPLDERLEAIETHLIVSALRMADGNKSRAATLLQIKRSTLGDRIKKLGIEDPVEPTGIPAAPIS